MNNCRFLAFLPDPFGIKSAQLVCCDYTGVCKEITLQEMSADKGCFVTYETSLLIDECRRSGIELSALLIDLEVALKMRSGKSRDQGGQKQWDIWRQLKQHFANASDCEAMRSLIQSRVERPAHEEVFHILEVTSVAIRDLWKTVESDLKTFSEFSRFIEVEVPIQNIFLFRQYHGIKIDKSRVSELIAKVKNEMYSAFRELASVLGFNPTGLTFATVGKYLDKTDANHLGTLAEHKLLEDYFKLAQETSSFAAAFLRFTRARQDLSVLTLMVGSGDRTYPQFQTFGTITGRILMSDPRLQQLRREYRGAISADEGKELIYLDFAQFEPGILAFLANDEEFIKQYNSQDLYSSLSHRIFGNVDKRTLCKRVFLAYCYGMSEQNIARLLAGGNATADAIGSIQSSVSDFFSAFPSLSNYRDRTQHELEHQGFVSSPLGNRRLRNSKDGLTYKEKRWALSHVVQGTASLIFKEALIALNNAFGKEAILIPMHDAVLLQFDPAEMRERKLDQVASQIMIDAFKRRCPSITPKIVAGSF